MCHNRRGWWGFDEALEGVLNVVIGTDSRCGGEGVVVENRSAGEASEARAHCVAEHRHGWSCGWWFGAGLRVCKDDKFVGIRFQTVV
jgi:hypothetical protein